MKEYYVDLTLNKEYKIMANSPEEAKERAIQMAREAINYYFLTIDNVKEVGEDE